MATEIARLFMAVDSSQVRGATRDLQGLAGAAGKMIGGLAIGGALAAMAKHVFNATAEFQKLQSQLVTVTGSAALAGQAFKDIEQFATETPFQLAEVVQAFTKMKAMGLDPSMESLRAWGDLASANGKNILDTVQAVANATMGEAEMLKQYGIKMMQAGNRVSFVYNGVTSTVERNSKAIEAHLMNLAKTNFGGGMQREMATIGGAMSNLQDQVDKASRAIGIAFGDQAIGLISQFTSLIDEATPTVKALAGDVAKLSSEIAGLSLEARDAIGPLSKVLTAGSTFQLQIDSLRIGIGIVRDAFNEVYGAVQVIYSLISGTVSGILIMLDKVNEKLGNGRSGYFDPWWEDSKRMNSEGWGRVLGGAQHTQRVLDGIYTRFRMNAARKRNPSLFAEIAEGANDAPMTQEERLKAEQKRLAAIVAATGATDAADKATQSFLGSLREEIATLGMTETQLLRYKAAKLGLSDNKEVQALIARKEAWNAEEKSIEDTVKALEDYAAKANLLGSGDTEKVLAEMAAFGPEAAKGLAEYTRTLDEITDQYADLRQASLYWQQDFTDALVEMTFTGKNLWRDMVDAMLRDLARLAVQKNVTTPLFDWLGTGLQAWLGGMGGGTTTGSAVTGFLGGQTSGVLGAAPGMGGTMPMKAAPTSTAPIIININQETGATSTQGSGDAARFGQYLGQKVREIIDDEKRPGGRLARQGAR
jgi:hypothetical protein